MSRLLTLSGSPYRELGEFFSRHRPAVQEFVVDPLYPAELCGEQGMVLRLPAFSLINAQGKLVNDKVRIRMRELTTRTDLLLSDQSSTSDHQLFDSLGYFQFSFWNDGEPLELNRPLTLQWPVPNRVKLLSGWQLFSLERSATRPLSGGERFNWRSVPGLKAAPSRQKEGRYLTVRLDRSGCFSLNHYWGKSARKAMLSAGYDLPGGDADDHRAFLVFHQHHTVVRLYDHNNKFTAFNLPARQPATLIITAFRKGRFFIGSCYLPHLDNRFLRLTLREVDEPTLMTELLTATV